MGGLGAQRGQATVEWVGLLLALAVAFGALLAGGRGAAKGESADGLGEAVAERITCAVRGSCGAGGATAGPRLHAAPGPPRALGRPRALAVPIGRGVPPRLAASVQAGGAGHALKGTWLLCLGYHRLRYDYEHPLTPRQAMPLGDVIDMVNQCMDPLSFLFG